MKRKHQRMLLGDKVVEIVARTRSKALFNLDGDLYVSFISRLKPVEDARSSLEGENNNG